MSDNTQQTMTQFVTDSVFYTMDNDNYHYDQIDICHRQNFRRQIKVAKYCIYADTVALGKQHAKQLRGR